MPTGYTYSNPYGYRSNQTVQSPTWSEYLAQYNQRQQGSDMAAHRVAPTEGYATLSPGMGMTMGAMNDTARNGPQQTASDYGEVSNATLHGTNFDSNPNNSYAKQAYTDWANDHKTGVNLLPGAANWRAVQSYQSYNRSRDAQANYAALVRAQQTGAQTEGRKDWATSLDPRIRVEMERRMAQAGGAPSTTMSDAEVQQMYQQLKTSDLQGSLTNQVQEHYKDPLRQTKLEEQIGNEKQNSLGQLADQYKSLRTKQAENAAGHGMLGSSVDISQRGQMGRARDAAAVGVENQAQQERSQFAQNDQQQQQQLMQMIYNTDPFQAGSAQNTLSYLQQMQQDRGDLNASQNQMYDINQFADSLYSQSIGGGLNAGAQGVGAYGPYVYQYMQNRGQQ